ncbi:choice-of-anchor H family protein [Flocculibacter collagenilyticus]|uniref:choice-of-anchor H family protein n=1 Tax=Flocculibacter collagenilyticus TaxID=2744479 RepID=UPI0018F404B6|nr:choice-of-anchor H family protein [Flocculibacter collagenilyticus]
MNNITQHNSATKRHKPKMGFWIAVFAVLILALSLATKAAEQDDESVISDTPSRTEGLRSAKHEEYTGVFKTSKNGTLNKRIQPVKKEPKTAVNTAKQPSLLAAKNASQLMQNKSSALAKKAKMSNKEVIAQSHDNEEFWIYELGLTTYSDFDYDGFHNQLSVSIDVDTVYQDADVYLVYQLSSDDLHYDELYTSSIIHLSHESTNDSVTVDTQLSTGWQSDYYLLRILVVDAYNDEILAHADYASHSFLDYMPLESLDFEAGFYTPYLFSSDLDLTVDNDADDFYSQLKVKLDIDTQAHEQEVVVALWLSDSAGHAFLLHESSPMVIEHDTRFDKYRLEKVIPDYIPTDLYSLTVEIINAHVPSELLYSSTIANNLHLENSHNDLRVVNEYVVEEKQGGALFGTMLLLLGVFGYRFAHRLKR